MHVAVLLATGFLILSFLLPGHYLPWLTVYHEFLAFTAGLLIVSMLLNFRIVATIKLPYIYLALIVPILILVAQYASDIIYFSGDVLIVSIYLISFLAMIIAGYNLAGLDSSSPALLNWLASAITIAAIISVCLALYQWLLQSSSIWIADLPPNGRPFANLAQPNQLATLLSMGLAGVLFFYEKHQIHRISSSLLALLLLFGIALTQSRTPWLMAVFFAVLWLWKFKAAPRRLPRPWAFAWVSIFVCMIFVLPYLADWLQLGGVSSVTQRAKASSRWSIYLQFVHAIIDGPLWGYGWQQAATAQLAVAPLYAKLEYTEYTHNIFLDLLVWNGPVLGSLIIVAVSFYLIRLAFLARSTENLFVLMAVGFFLLHSLLEYPHAYAYFLLPVGLLIGCLQAEFPCKVWSIPRWCVLTFMTISIGLYAVIWQEYRLIEEDFRLMRFEKNRVGTLKADKPAPDVILLTQLQAQTKHLRLPATTNMSADELAELARFAKRFTHPAALFKYAQALALNGQPDDAYQQLMLIKRLHGEKMFSAGILELDTLKEKHSELTLLLQRLN